MMRVSKEERRKILLESAKALFIEKGYHSTTTRDIAKAAGVSEPMIYKHFSSKHELYFEVIYQIFSALLDELMIDEEIEPEAFIERFIYYHMETVSKQFNSLKFILSQLLHDPDVKDTFLKVLLPKMKGRMFPIIKNMGRVSGESLEYSMFLLGGFLLVFELADGLFNFRPGGLSREELSKKLAKNYMDIIKGGSI